MICQLFRKFLKYKTFLPGFVMTTLLFLLMQNLKSDKNDLHDMTSLLVSTKKFRANFRLYLNLKEHRTYICFLIILEDCVHFSLQERLEEMKLELFPNQSEVSFDEYQLNVQLSNRLPLFRNIPDARPPECLAKRYGYCAFKLW